MITPNRIEAIQQKLANQSPKLHSTFYALGDQGRLKAFRVLLQYQDICVSEIAVILKISVPAASRQLKILEQAGLIIRERQGQMICYKVNKGNSLVKTLINILSISPSKIVTHR